MSHSLIQQLAELTRTHPFHNKWVLVPNHEVGWTLAERLLLEGHNWLNFRFQTTLQLALEAAAPYLWAQGVEACPRQLGPGSLHALAPHPYSQLMSQPGMDQELWNRLRRSRLQAEPWEPFQSLFEQLLQQRGWADEAMVYRCQAESRVRCEDLVILYPDHDWPVLVRDFVARLPGQHLPSPDPIHLQPTLSFFCASRREAEFEEIVARLEGPVDQVEIAIPRQDVSLLYDILCQHQIPATFSFGLPLLLSRPAQALRDFLAWLSKGVSGNQFRELLMSNYLVAPPSSWVAARLLAAAGIRWGRQDYSDRLEALESRCMAESNSTWLDLQATQARQLANWFERLFERFPVHENGTVPFRIWIDGLAFVLREYLDRHDPEATQLLLEILEDFGQLSDQDWELAQFEQHLKIRLESSVWRASRPRPGHIHVSSLADLGLSGRSRVFLAAQEEEEEAAEPLPPLQAHITFSYSLRCREGEREQFPGARFLQHQGPDWRAQPAPTRLWQDSGRAFPDLDRGLRAQQLRRSSEFTEYDGFVPEASHLRLPTSASGLQSLAACPYRFFLSRALKVYPQPLPEPSRDQWLNPMEQGQVLHEMFAGWLEGQTDPLALLDQALFKQPPAAAAWLETRERSKLIEHFLHFTRLQPAPDQQTLREYPFDLVVAITDDLQLHIKGVIDRIDFTLEGLRVIDYKTGRTFHLPEQSRYSAGRHLQPALYALAAENALQQPVCQSGYLATHPEAEQNWRILPPPERAELARILRLILQPLNDGTFIQSHQSHDDCRYCDFQAACVDRQSRQIKKKLASSLLESRRMLLETL